jgi:hypothetical protein
VFGIGSIRGETEVVGVFDSPADDAALPAFVEQLRETMIAHLALMRGRRGRTGTPAHGRTRGDHAPGE